MTALSRRFDFNRLSLGRILPATATIAALTVALILTAGLYQRDQAIVSSQMEHYGNTLASQIAALAAEPLMAGDRVALNRLVARLATAEEVVTVGIYTLDNRTLASIDADATIGATVYSTAITFDETIAGYVRVGLDRGIFERPHQDFLLWAALISVLATLSVAGIAIGLGRVVLPPLLKLHQSALAIARERGVDYDNDTPAKLGAPKVGAPTLGEFAALSRALAPDEAIKPVHAPNRPLYALVLNIFNQISLPSDERRHVLNLCRERVHKVCRLYNGRVMMLPGTGILALFDGFPDDDHAFQAICAAVLTRDLVSDLNHRRLGQDRAELLFRLGLDPLPPRQFADADENSILDLLREELQHTVMLSATARNNTVAISRAVFDSILDPARLELSEQRFAAIRSPADGGVSHCYLVDGVVESYGALLDRQAELLLYETSY